MQTTHCCLALWLYEPIWVLEKSYGYMVPLIMCCAPGLPKDVFDEMTAMIIHLKITFSSYLNVNEPLTNTIPLFRPFKIAFVWFLGWSQRKGYSLLALATGERKRAGHDINWQTTEQEETHALRQGQERHTLRACTGQRSGVWHLLLRDRARQHPCTETRTRKAHSHSECMYRLRECVMILAVKEQSKDRDSTQWMHVQVRGVGYDASCEMRLAVREQKKDKDSTHLMHVQVKGVEYGISCERTEQGQEQHTVNACTGQRIGVWH